MRLFFVMFLIFGCSFKPPEENDYAQKLESYAEDMDQRDTDGDGLNDGVERKEGTDPFIADIPSFEGQFFQDLKVTTRLIRRLDNKEESVSFHVRKDGVSENGTEVAGRDFLRTGSRYAMEYGALLAKKNGFSMDHLAGDIEVSHLELYSPPRLNDAKIFPYSEKIKKLEDTFSYESIEIHFSNSVLLTSNRFKRFSEMWIDLYYYDSLEHKFTTVGSQLLQGTYYFNRNHQIPLTFRSNNPALVRAISDSGGRHLYVKIRDFKIDETEIFFSSLLENVKKKSVPLIFNNQEGHYLKYVGINGSPTGFSEILKRGIQEEVVIQSGKLLGIGKYTNSRTLDVSPYGESLIVENKWFVLTRDIGQNPFAYSFSPSEPIVVTYLSQNDPFDLIPSYFSDYASSERPETLKIFKVLTKNLMNIVLTIKPLRSITVSSKAEIMGSCDYSPSSSICFSYRPITLDLRGLEATPVFSTLDIGLNGKRINLRSLINSKVASFRLKNKDSFEIKFNPKIFELVDDSNGVTMSLHSVQATSYSCNGIKYCEDNGIICRQIYARPPLCEESGTTGNGYILIDKTNKNSVQDIGDLFFSIEYI